MMGIKKQVLTLAGSGVLTISAAVVGYFEGKRNYAYLDVVGVPTICYGHTQGVKLGDYMTDEECKDLLRKDLKIYHQAVVDNVKVQINETTAAALVSFAYNVGENAFKKSTLLKKLNNGDRMGACDELRRWVNAGGRQWKGLINRREVERWMCRL